MHYWCRYRSLSAQVFLYYWVLFLQLKDPLEDTTFVERVWHLSDTLDVTYWDNIQEHQAIRTWLTWMFPTSSLSLKARGPQVCLQALGSNLGMIEQPWLEEQTLVWLYLHDSAVSVAQSQPPAILKAVTEGQSQCTVLSRPESSGKPGVLLGVMLSHHWPWGDAACGTAVMRDSANDVKGQSESFPFVVASQNF